MRHAAKFCGKKSAEFVQDFETIILCDFLARFQKVFLSFLPAFEEFYRVFCNALNFLSSFLLAHCGGGQDKPGLPWPLSEAPRLSFFFSAFCFQFFSS